RHRADIAPQPGPLVPERPRRLGAPEDLVRGPRVRSPIAASCAPGDRVERRLDPLHQLRVGALAQVERGLEVVHRLQGAPRTRRSATARRLSRRARTVSRSAYSSLSVSRSMTTHIWSGSSIRSRSVSVSNAHG